MLNRRLLVYTSGRVTNQPPEGLIITVIDYDTKQPVANAHVDIRDASGIMHSIYHLALQVLRGCWPFQA